MREINIQPHLEEIGLQGYTNFKNSATSQLG